jgi:hypothetical protein
MRQNGGCGFEPGGRFFFSSVELGSLLQEIHRNCGKNGQPKAEKWSAALGKKD